MIDNSNWYNSLSFYGFIGIVFFAILLILGIVSIMTINGKALIAVESSKVIEQLGNNAVSELTIRSSEIAALTKNLATISEQLPKSVSTFKSIIPKLIDFRGDFDIAGGGVWPEPYAFQSDKKRRSFFWARNLEGSLIYYDDYNKVGMGYHHEEWYVAVRHMKPGTCSWSESYMDPYSYQPMVTCSVATFDHNAHFSGVVTIDLKLEGLQALIASVQQKSSGYVFIVDRNNKFISFPQPELVTQLDLNIQGTPSKEFMLASEFIEPLFEPLAQALDMMTQDILRHARDQKNYNPSIATTINQESYKIDHAKAELLAAIIANPIQNNRTYLYKTVHLEQEWLLKEASTAFIFHVPHSYWKLVIVKPNSNINAVASNISRILIFHIVATTLIILGLIYLVYSHLLIRPLSQTTQALQEMGLLANKMKFEELKVLEIPYTRFNEIGLLIEVFDKITIQVIEQHCQLKTVNKALEENIIQLTQLNILKDEFLENTSQELKTPLNSIIGLAESLNEGVTGSLNASTKSNLVMIVNTGKRLSVLVNNILDFSKLKHNTLELQQISVTIKELLDVVLTLHQSLASAKDVHLINNIASDLPPAFADENRVQQILHNLVSNAIKFTETGYIVIYGKVVNDFLEICISDTGSGMTVEQLQHIFESYNEQESLSSHIGLGLAITKQLVELHGGRIWIESQIHQGTRCYFTLPISTQTETVHTALLSFQELVVSPPENMTSKTTILCVDDEPVTLQVLHNYLYLEDYHIIQAKSGSEALHLIENGLKPDAVVLDVMMPKMTGYEVTKKIREKWKADELPIILLTANNQIADLVMGLEVGANDYLTKPVSKDELLARLKIHLNLTHLKAENMRMGAELEVTRRIQQMLLPKAEELDQVVHLEISGFMAPAEEVGGDYYDVLQHDGRLFIGIGDATGHGLESGMLALMTQTAVRTLLEHGETDIKKFLPSINGMIYKNVQERMQVDKNLSLSILEYKSLSSGGGVLYITGQHEDVIVVRNGELEQIDTCDLGFFIGLIDNINDDIAQTEILLQKGDVVVLYTDGITEAVNPKDAEYGIERLCHIVQQHWQTTAESIKNIVIDDVRQFMGQQKVFDDITLLVLKHK